MGGFFYPQICNKFKRLNRIAHHYQNEHFQNTDINYTELWEKCNLLSVSERLSYFNALTAFHAISYARIPDISELFEIGSSDRTRKVKLLSHNSEIFKKSPFYQGMVTWNSLSSEAREFGLSLGRFKKEIDMWLLNERLSEFVPS